MLSDLKIAAYFLIPCAGFVSSSAYADLDRLHSSRLKAAKCSRLTRSPLSPEEVNRYFEVIFTASPNGKTMGASTATQAMKAAILGGWPPDLLRRHYGMVRSALELPDELSMEAMKSFALTGWSTRELKDYFTAIGDALPPGKRIDSKSAVEAMKAAVLGGWTPEILVSQYKLVRLALDLPDELVVEVMKSVAVAGWTSLDIRKYFSAITDALPSGRLIKPRNAVEAMKAAVLGGWSPEVLGGQYKSVRLALGLPEELVVEAMKAAASGNWSPLELKKYYTAITDLSSGGMPIESKNAVYAMKAAAIGSWTPQELRRQFFLIREKFPELSEGQVVEVMDAFANSGRSVLITGLVDVEFLF